MTPGALQSLLGGAAWSFPGSILDGDFVHIRGAVNRKNASLSSLLSVTNSTGGYVTTSSGLLVSKPANTLRISDQGLLIEQASTNIFLWSQAPSHWGLLTGSSSGANNTGIAPDGTNTAGTISGTVNGQDGLGVSATIANDSTTWTPSIFIRKISGTPSYYYQIQSRIDGGASPTQNTVVFSPQTGVVGANPIGTLTVTSCGDWWFVSLPITNNSSGNTTLRFRVSGGNTTNDRLGTTYTGATSEIVWGAQAENLAFPTSYIPTTSTTASRSADVITGSFVARSVGTVIATVLLPNTYSFAPANQVIFSLNDTTTNNRIATFINTGTGALQGRYVISGVAHGPGSVVSPVIQSNVPMKFGQAYDSTNNQIAAGGTAGTTAATGGVPVTTQLSLGVAEAGNANWLDGYLQRLTILNYRASQTQLQALTT